jgi:hypothetical protein
MLNFDLSKVVPQKALTHLTFLIPGSFFEVSILLANPGLLANHLNNLHQAIPVSPYLLLGFALLIAFIIGSAAIAFVDLLGLLLKRMYGIRHSVAISVLATLLKVITRRTLTTKVTIGAVPGMDDADRAMRAWRRLAVKLLRDRYGVEPRHLKTDWVFYMYALGDPSEEEVEGPLIISILHATGWCGLVATFLAPALRSGYYLGPCLIFMIVGLLGSYTAVCNRTNRMAIAMSRMRVLIREYEKDRLAISTTQKPL